MRGGQLSCPPPTQKSLYGWKSVHERMDPTPAYSMPGLYPQLSNCPCLPVSTGEPALYPLESHCIQDGQDTRRGAGRWERGRRSTVRLISTLISLSVCYMCSRMYLLPAPDFVPPLPCVRLERRDHRAVDPGSVHGGCRREVACSACRAAAAACYGGTQVHPMRDAWKLEVWLQVGKLLPSFELLPFPVNCMYVRSGAALLPAGQPPRRRRHWP